jgi:hypothetical protein
MNADLRSSMIILSDLIQQEPFLFPLYFFSIMLLRLHSSGNEVQEWQSFLVKQNLLSADACTGNFDQATDDATRKFQIANNLKADGVVGNATWERANLTGYESKSGNASKALQREDIENQAKIVNISPAALKSVTTVEAAGSGFLTNGKLKILFEGHIFWAELKKRGKNPSELSNSTNRDILYERWTKEFYSKNSADEHGRLDRARSIDSEAANRSASWGMFQIMGNNCEMIGYKTVEAMIEDFFLHERNQLKGFIVFIQKRKIDGYLRERNWSKFAEGYNGPGYKANQYDEKLAKAYLQAVNAGWQG